MIIGSNCIKYHFSDFPREPKDVDIVVLNSKEQSVLKSAYSNSNIKTEILLNPVLINWFKNKRCVPHICYINELYTLKISHCFWDLKNNSWDKHIWDIQWLKEKGCKFIPELFYQLYDYWQTIHGKNKRSNLELSSKDFFTNAVNYPVDHDFLHELLITHPYFNNQEKPTYPKILKDGAEVDVCMDKFKNLTELEKFNVVFEEVGIMMLENRYPKEMYWKKKYEKMLKKFVLNHCKIEEAIWIIQNHKKLITEIPFDFCKFLKIKENELQIN